MNVAERMSRLGTESAFEVLARGRAPERHSRQGGPLELPVFAQDEIDPVFVHVDLYSGPADADELPKVGTVFPSPRGTATFPIPAERIGEVPIGAVVVCDGAVVASGHNRREIDHDPAGHAELLVIREASRRLERWRLSDCTVYVTLEPCPM